MMELYNCQRGYERGCFLVTLLAERRQNQAVVGVKASNTEWNSEAVGIKAWFTSHITAQTKT
jgi:hypothetical protein